MRVRFPCHVVTFAALVVLVRFPGNAVAQEPDQQGPVEIDIVITTRLNTTKEHVAAFRESLRKGAEKAFDSLKPTIYGEEQKPNDGAARFRLMIEHKGTVVVGNALIPMRSRNPGGDDNVSWQVQTGQDGEIAFRFLQWEGGKYKPLGGWSIPAGQDAPGGRIEVATDEVAAGRALPRQMPLTIPEARAKALEKLLPRDIMQPLLDGLLKVEMLQADAQEEGDRVKGAAEVVLTNVSPWPVEKASIAVEWTVGPREALRITVEHRFEKPLATRQDARFSGTGWTGQADPKRLNPPRVTSVSFAPAPAQPAGPPTPVPKKR